jgi:lipid-binding SYLF domain-containing protein
MKKIILGVITVGIAACAFALEPVELDNRIHTLAAKFEQMQNKPDKAIPAESLRRAQGIILLDRTKAGLVFAYQGGSGVAMIRNKDGEWSAPAFFAAHEGSLGFQVGGEKDFYAILLMNTNVTKLLTEPNFEAGGEARGTAGDSSSGTEGKVTSGEQPMIVYSMRKGLYGGAVVKAGAIYPDEQANHVYYSHYVSVRDILFDNKVKPTQPAAELAKRIDDYTKTAQK